MSVASPNKPMPQMPIIDLKPGSRVDSVYHLVSVERRSKKNGDPFFMLQLADGSGTVNGVIWDNHVELQTGAITKDHFVHVSGDVGEYNGKLQLTLKRVVALEDRDVDLAAFLPVSPRDRAEMEKELDAWIAKVTNNDCRRLLDRLFGHQKLRELYCMAPAAARIHQAYIHGLLEHTLNVVRLADGIASLYEPINRDLLITGTLIHDIGKVRELEWTRTITYTTEGRLLGHIPMGVMMIDQAIAVLKVNGGFSESLRNELLHLILSHHGKLEWGSPITPKSREALVLHYADHAEAYMSSFVDETRKATEQGSLWTAWSRMFESYLYTGATANDKNAAGESDPGFEPEKKRDPMDDVYTAK